VLNMKESNEPADLVPVWSALVTRNFSWYNQVMLDEDDYILLWLRVYTPDPAKTFVLQMNSEALPLVAPFPAKSAGQLSWTTFWCSFVSASTQDAT
jgi:hypothetical protein